MTGWNKGFLEANFNWIELERKEMENGITSSVDCLEFGSFYWNGKCSRKLKLRKRLIWLWTGWHWGTWGTSKWEMLWVVGNKDLEFKRELWTGDVDSRVINILIIIEIMRIPLCASSNLDLMMTHSFWLISKSTLFESIQHIAPVLSWYHIWKDLEVYTGLFTVSASASGPLILLFPLLESLFILTAQLGPTNPLGFNSKVTHS